MKKTRQRAQIKIRNEEEEVTTDITEIQYANKLDNLEEMDKFLERYSLPRPNQGEIENMHRTINSSEMESVI